MTDVASRTLEVRNPSRTAEVVGVVVDGSAADAAAAVDAAAAAASAWAATTVGERVERLRRIADAVDANADRLIDLATRENGSIVATIRREVAASAHSFRDVADYLAGVLQPSTTGGASADEFVRVERRPYGVVACVVPWNAPVLLTANKLAPAIAAGNAVVLKPSPFAPLAVSLLAALAAAELPDGVVNVVNGDAEVVRALVDDARVRKISFTGGGATAQAHHASGGRFAAPRCTSSWAETTRPWCWRTPTCGFATDRIVLSAFRRAGQVCFAIKRVYVPRSVAG